MSRHRFIRNMRLDDYLDDYDDDDYDYDDYDDDHNNANDTNNYYQNSSSDPHHALTNPQTEHQTAHEEPSPLEDDILDEILPQFRQVLADDTLTREQVSTALTDADFDWETALTILRTRPSTSTTSSATPALPEQASPIAQLVADAADAEDQQQQQQQQQQRHQQSISFRDGQVLGLRSLPPERSSKAAVPDYEAFVADIGTTLHISPDANNHTEAPFRFDKPSPDDVIRSKQAKGFSRPSAPIRLPKPATSSTHARTPAMRPSESPVKSSDTSTSASGAPSISVHGSGSGEGKSGVTVPPKPRKLIRPPPRAAEPPRRNTRENAANVTQTQTQKPLRQRLKPVDLSKRITSTAPSLAVIVAGHVDAGKSTLIGHLLQQLASSSPSSKTSSEAISRRRQRNIDLAWTTDEDPVERDRGVTIDIASRVIVRPGDPSRIITLIDSPGHRDFVPAMILGAAQAGAALLVVDASPGEFEAGFAELGQTREHAIVLKAFGVSSLIVVVNKMDVAEYSKERFDEVRKSITDFLRSNGWKSTGSNVKFVPVSGREGVNLTTGPGSLHPMSKWYSGRTLIQEIDALPGASVSEVHSASSGATRLVITDFSRNSKMGGQVTVTGRLLRGSVASRDKLTAVPGGVTVTVRSVGVGEGDDRVPVAIAGLDAAPVAMGLSDMPEGAVLGAGCVLCDPQAVAKGARLLRVRLLVTGADVLVMRGTRGVLHVAGASEAASVVKLCEYVGGKKGKGERKRVPRRLVKGNSAIVEISCERAVAMERMEDVKVLGRLAFRQEGRTVAVGIVLEILRTEKDEQEEAARKRREEEGDGEG